MPKVPVHIHQYTIPVEWQYQCLNTHNIGGSPYILSESNKAIRKVAVKLLCPCGDEVVR